MSNWHSKHFKAYAKQKGEQQSKSYDFRPAIKSTNDVAINALVMRQRARANAANKQTTANERRRARAPRVGPTRASANAAIARLPYPRCLSRAARAS